MSSVHAITEEFVFKARVASFREIPAGLMMNLNEEFGLWLKQKGKDYDFLVWRVQFDIEGKKRD